MADKNDFIAASGIMAKFEAHAKGLEASVNHEYRAGLLKGYEFICEEEPADVVSREEYDALKKELEQYKKTQPIGCPKCSRGNFANDKYCSHCGARLGGDVIVTKNS